MSNKAKNIKIPLLQQLMDETTELQKKQVEDRIDFAMKLSEIIKKHGYTHIEFAKKIGRSPSEVSRWVSGIHNLTLATISEIAHGLGINIAELFEKNNESILVIEKTITVKATAKNYPNITIKPTTSISIN